jgi:acyl-coenzyme A synthetase/AMP-(fatty) acid ligase
VQGVLDRFGQIEPKVLFVADAYLYGGKEFDCQDKAAAVLERLPSVEECVVVDYLGRPVSAGTPLDEFVEPFDAAPIRFERMEFNQPLYILYSSGTTGVPKCIVHGAGGTLLQHLKEHRRRARGRPPVLLHHARLDDVELARFRPRCGRDAAALRRLAVRRPRTGVVRSRRCRGHDALRHLRQVH